MNSDTYLSTDDEGDEDSLLPKVARKRSKKQALEQEELALAKRVAKCRIERHEIMEIERAFAVLDNVQEGKSYRQRNRHSKSKPQLNPRQNPFIQNEAVEVGDSDSDLANEESFDTLNVSGQSNTSSASGDNETDSKLSPPISQKQSTSSDSDLSDSEDWPTLYENYCASRELMEAQIQREQMQMISHGNQSSSSESMSRSYETDDLSDGSTLHTDQFSRSTMSDDSGNSSMELEASFSSVAEKIRM